MGLFAMGMLILMALAFTAWRMRPPQSDQEPISEESLNNILKKEAQKGWEP